MASFCFTNISPLKCISSDWSSTPPSLLLLFTHLVGQSVCLSVCCLSQFLSLSFINYFSIRIPVFFTNPLFTILANFNIGRDNPPNILAPCNWASWFDYTWDFIEVTEGQCGKVNAIWRSIYYLHFLRGGGMPCHAGPHGKVPGLVEKQSSKRRTWLRAFIVFSIRKKRKGKAR